MVQADGVVGSGYGYTSGKAHKLLKDILNTRFLERFVVRHIRCRLIAHPLPQYYFEHCFSALGIVAHEQFGMYSVANSSTHDLLPIKRTSRS